MSNVKSQIKIMPCPLSCLIALLFWGPRWVLATQWGERRARRSALQGCTRSRASLSLSEGQ